MTIGNVPVSSSPSGAIRASEADLPTERLQPSSGTTTLLPQDTVKLSVNAQIKQLSQSGENAKQIAANLGITEKQVQEALGDTTAETSKLATLLGAH